MSRLVSSEEDFDSLPIGAVIRCDDLEEVGMNVAERDANGWVFVGHGESYTSKQMAEDRVDYLVLWEPAA